VKRVALQGGSLRGLVGFLVMMYLILSVPALWMACFLVVEAETDSGQVFAWTCLVWFGVPLLLWARVYSKRFSLVAAAGSLFLIGLGLLCFCWILTPSGEPESELGLSSVWLGTGRYQRLSPANLVPEIDQLKLGAAVFPALDPFIDQEQGERVNSLFLQVYRTLRRDQSFVEVGSALGACYEDLFLGKREQGHVYLYLPPQAGSEEPLPVILFLHGSLGNFKGYLWVWKQFADQHGFAIVAPSFGAGNWYLPGGMEAVEAAWNFCEQDSRLDTSRMILAGLSNGGTGLSRAALRDPERYQGLIFLSPVMEDSVLNQPAFYRAWRDRPILVISGQEDRRIPRARIQEVASALESEGVDVQSAYLANEDHFLLFSQPEQCMQLVGEWVQEQLNPHVKH